LKLQTEILLTPNDTQVDYQSKVLLLGSCFVENIGEKLNYFKFQNLQNPLGIIFNPVSIEKLVRRAIDNEHFTEVDIFLKDENWHCFEVHSLISASTKIDFLELLNNKLQQLREYLLTASHIIFTYGTAWVYRNTSSRAIVANCHKVSQNEFSKELLSVTAISAAIKKTVSLIIGVNSNAIIITTLSPVRHLKDGFVENNRSKAHLLSGLHEVVDAVDRVNYFPAFEIVMDELREYRFYKQDMLHPNEIAIEIIWEKFKKVWIASKTESLQKQIDTIQKGLQHRPFNPKSLSYKKFQENLQKKIVTIKESFPEVDFS